MFPDIQLFASLVCSSDILKIWLESKARFAYLKCWANSSGGRLLPGDLLLLNRGKILELDMVLISDVRLENLLFFMYVWSIPLSGIQS